MNKLQAFLWVAAALFATWVQPVWAAVISTAAATAAIKIEAGGKIEIGGLSKGDAIAAAVVDGVPGGLTDFSGSPAKFGPLAAVTTAIPAKIPALAGLGYLKVPKTPAPASASAVMGPVTAKSGTLAQSSATWTSRFKNLGTWEVTHVPTAKVDVIGALSTAQAAGEAVDPVFFTVEDGDSAHVTYEVTSVALTSIADPGDDGAAAMLAKARLGTGSDPEDGMVLATGFFTKTVVATGSYSSSTSVMVLDYTVGPGSYWLEANLVAGAVGTTVPEPSTALLMAAGFLGLGLYCLGSQFKWNRRAT